MNTIIIYLILAIFFWIYTNKINRNFYTNIENRLVDYVNRLVKKINVTDTSLFNTNIQLIKMNLYLITFNKNIDLYNKIYNSDDFAFFNNKSETVDIQLSNLSSLVPDNIFIQEDLMKSKFSMTKINNIDLFPKFFLDLSNSGIYLLDCWNLFYDLLKPFIIINAKTLTSENKIIKLNELKWNVSYDNDIVLKITNNTSKIITVIFKSILILSKIIKKYKEIIDLHKKFNMNEVNINNYNINQQTIINDFTKIKTELDTYLNNTEFEYSYIKNYFSNTFVFDDFINEQFNSNYALH